ENAEARLVYGAGEDFMFHEHVQAARLDRAMLAALEKVAAELSRAAHERGESIRHAMLTFSAPWYIAETKILYYKHDTPIEITAATIDALIEEAWRRFGTTPSTIPHARGEREAGDESTLIEQSIARVALNGYPTRSPVGKVACTLEIALYLSRISRSTLEAIDAVLARTMPGASAVPHSEALVLSSVLRGLFPAHEDFLLCHVGAEMTELALVIEGVLLETVSFPYGSHTLVRELSSATKSVPAATLSLLSLDPKDMDEKTTRRTSEAIRTLGERWFAELSRSLASLTDTHGLMPTWCMVLAENMAMTERFRQFILGEGSASAFLGGGILHPTMIPEQALATKLTCEVSAAPCMRDISLACEAIFAQSTLLSTR
ncbi:MAG: hypothetical protein U1A28_02640, partial [Patescibacteria group bacterium]|nr:hypothetical protein [Patescibacteria group bacterium]